MNKEEFNSQYVATQQQFSEPESDNEDRQLTSEDVISPPKLWLPKRYLMAFLGFFGVWNVYGMRVNLSVAIVRMVQQKNVTLTNGTVQTHQDFDWDTTMQGELLSSFFWGYIVTQLPGGIIAGKVGGKKVYGIGVFSTAFFTLLTPVVASYGGYNWLIALRILEGLGEGVTFPALLSFWTKWAPKYERTKLVAISYCGSYAGTVVAMPLCGFLAEYVSWESIFYIYGGFGCFWCIIWVLFASETPEQHSSISKEELEYIQATRGTEETAVNFRDIPWKSIFTSLPVYGIIIAHFSENWGFYTLLTELPSYMKDVLHFDLKNSGMLSAVPYLCMTIIVFISSQVADYIRKRQYLSTTAVRKLFNTIAYLGQMTFLLLTGFASSPTIAVVYLTFAIGCGGLAMSGFNVNHLDISPKYAGILMGISNTVATIPGILSPAIAGIITKDKTEKEWRVVFYISSSLYAFGAIMFALLASGKVQAWDDPDRIKLDKNDLEGRENHLK